MTTELYDLVPYEDHPVAETHVDRLHVAARRAGLDAVRPERARVLELGCAHGVNLVPMAFHLPDARFVGVDRSAGQIERGRARLAGTDGLALPNLELIACDVLDLDLGEARFDYVIAHGLFSWVPEPVRARVLGLCAQHLSDAGVAYLSFNALPAWGVRDAVRRALRELVEPGAEPRDAVRRAREALARLALVRPLAGTAEGALLDAEIDAVRHKPDAYLLHEYLEPENRAFYLREVVDRASRAGLRWLTDVAPTGVAPSTLRDARRALSALSDDSIVVEQLTDVMSFRQFRASLLCRAEAAVDHAPDPRSLLSSCRVAARPSPRGEPAAGRALAALVARWPADRSLDELAADLAVDAATLVEELVPLVDDERVELRPRALPIGVPGSGAGGMTRVSELARFESRHLPYVTTQLHELAPLDGFHAALVMHADGRPASALVEALLEDVRAGRLRVSADGPPPIEALRAALPALVAEGLARLAAAGLLSG